MQARAGSDTPVRTFTETARRAQIVAAAIDTLADVGYGAASLSAIARRAGLSSTGLITYHFANKAELIAEVVEEVIGVMRPFMAERIAAAQDPAGMLRAYIRGNVEFIGTHRRHMKALLEVFVNGGVPFDAAANRSVSSPLEEILRAGQATGQFRPGDARVIASAIQRAIEGTALLLESAPDLDLDLYAQELLALFETGLHTGNPA
ncbi:MAG: TetR/AcrR family transcriptional regulator [Solirubrobacteraceae bacterium]